MHIYKHVFVYSYVMICQRGCTETLAQSRSLRYLSISESKMEHTAIISPSPFNASLIGSKVFLKYDPLTLNAARSIKDRQDPPMCGAHRSATENTIMRTYTTTAPFTASSSGMIWFIYIYIYKFLCRSSHLPLHLYNLHGTNN